MGNYKKIAGIYQVQNLLTRKVYIGHSRNIRKRLDKHKYELRRNCHENQHLQNSWNLDKEDKFIFSIIEVLPLDWNTFQYEEVETKWVLLYNSHKKEFGYNKCLPGAIPLKLEDENITKKRESNIPVIMFNILSKEKLELNSYKEIIEKFGFKINKIIDCTSYWKDSKTGRKSHKNWIIVKKEDYKESFDYINFKKERKKSIIKKTWRDYYKPKSKKDPETIIPYEERNLKRCSIIALHKESGEEIVFLTIKSASEKFLIKKVYKCLNNEFKKYSHRGYYFKRKELFFTKNLEY